MPAPNAEGMANNFQRFLETHPKYRAVYDDLLHIKSPDQTGRLLAAAAQLVYRIQGEALGPVANETLTFVDHCYPPDYVDHYIARVGRLAALQRRFDHNPSDQTLGDPDTHVDPDDYS